MNGTTRVNGRISKIEGEFVELTDLESLDGPPSRQNSGVEVTASNLFGWNLFVGGTAKAEYNNSRGRWELYQASVPKYETT